MSVLPLSAVTPCGTELCRSYAYRHGLCGFICVLSLLCLEGPGVPHPFSSYNLSASSSTGFPKGQEKELMEIPHLGLSFPRSLTLRATIFSSREDSTGDESLCWVGIYICPLVVCREPSYIKDL